MRFHLVTLFPEFFESPLACGLLAKGVEKGLLEFCRVNPRDFTTDAHRTVDDRPYGGGPGMVMICEPLEKAIASLPANAKMLLMSPGGKPFTQAMARELAEENEIAVVCGRYEGVDERLLSLFPLEPVCVGDFVLNGGEAAALCLVEAVSRLIPGFMGHEDSTLEESFSQGLLEYPHYTRPEIYKGLPVPEILTSGDHAKIARWRKEKALAKTLEARPEMLEHAAITKKDAAFLRGRPRAGLSRNLYPVLIHYPVLNKRGETVAVSLTNLDVHDIARVSRTFGLGAYFMATPLEDQRLLLERLLAYWLYGPGTGANPDRARALSVVRVRTGLDEIRKEVEAETGVVPRLVAATASGAGTMDIGKVREWLLSSPVLLLLGTGSGLAPEIMDQASGVLRPIRFLDAYNHLSVRSAAAILVDRVLGDWY